MAVLIDTSILIEVERRGHDLDAITGEVKGVVSIVTASELLVGVHHAPSDHLAVRRRAFAEHVIAYFKPLPLTTPIARVHAETKVVLQRRGETLDPHDLWIAATALAHGHRLVTKNGRHFERVPGLELVAL